MTKQFVFFVLAVSACAAGFLMPQRSRAQGFVEAPALPMSVPATSASLRYVGRFDHRASEGPRCSWPASEITLRFREATAVNARLADTDKDDRWQVEIDGKPTRTLTLEKGAHTYAVATGLSKDEHIVRLIKATEAFCGVTQILGFELSAGSRLLPPVAPAHRIEVIGDSISCGYGDEAKSEKETFSPNTENAYFAYGAVAARTLNADYACVAWSGRKLWPDNTVPAIYDLKLPSDNASEWAIDPAAWTPDVVLVNLATNDFSEKNPDETGWTGAYRAFIAHLRYFYPRAEIYCALGPCMSDQGEGDRKPYTVLTAYVTRTVADRAQTGDTHVHVLEFAHQKRENGLGADYHPSLRTHEIMAATLEAAIKRDLKW